MKPNAGSTRRDSSCTTAASRGPLIRSRSVTRVILRQRRTHRCKPRWPGPCSTGGMNALAPIGRFMFSLIFVMSLPNHFKQQTIDYAAAAGVPLAHLAVPLAGINALHGTQSILQGFPTRVGGIALLVFLVPVTLSMHRVWGLSDPQQVQMQQINFLKNVALMGGALFFVYAGSGAYSLGSRMLCSALD